jgi:hypothetical protein
MSDPASTERSGTPAGTPAHPVRRQAARIAGIAGLTFVALFVVGFVLVVIAPDPSESDERILDFYATGGKRFATILGAYVIPFAGIAFMWFMASMRNLLREYQHGRDPIFQSMQLVSGTLFIAAIFVAAAASATQATSIAFFDAATDASPADLRQLPALGYAIFFLFGIKMAGVFMATTSNLGRGLLPRWLTITGVVFAVVLLLSAAIIQPLALLLPAWVTVLSVWLLLVPARESVGDPRQPTA